MAATHIEVRGVTKVFGRRPRRALALVRAGMSRDELLHGTGATLALHDVSLTVGTGEIFVVMGLSGSGKSTLIRHINRLIDPTEGRIIIGGIDVTALSIPALVRFRRRHMSMVFQRFGLLPHRTVAGNVAFGLEILGVGRAERRRRAQAWIQQVGLSGYERHYPSELSGGMQQRVGLARAMAPDHDILLMDEPFSALDPLIRAEMQAQLLELQARLGKTIVFVTHDLNEALRLASRIAILNAGRLIQVAAPAEILAHPADDYVRAFVEEVRHRGGGAAGPGE